MSLQDELTQLRDQALGEIGKTSGHQVPDSPFLCDYPWRYLYADRHFYQSGSAWYDSGSRL